MKFWTTPAGAAIIVGIIMAVVSLYGGIHSAYAAYVALIVLFGFAFWLSRWIHYRVFGPAVWLGILLTLWAPIVHTAFIDTYRLHHPGLETPTTRWAFFAEELLGAGVSILVLALLASMFATGPRRRENERRAAAAAEAEAESRTPAAA